MNVGEYIKTLRENKNMTQEELGKIIGVQRAAVQKWESGKVQNLKRETIKRLSDFFEVPASNFIDTSEDEVSPFDQKFAEILASMSERTKKSFVDFMSSETNRKFFELLINANDSDLEWLEFLLKTKLEERK